MTLRFSIACRTSFAIAVLTPMVAAAQTPPLAQGSYTTPAAVAGLAGICNGSTPFPQAAPLTDLTNAPASATTGSPRIEQYRGGILLATYTSFSDQPGCTLAGDGTDHLNPGPPAATGCGPFTREHSWRLWESGDIFKVYPAVYSGEYNQPWFGPEFDDSADATAGISHTPDNILVQGVIRGHTRPVIVLDQGASNNTLGQAPIYFDQSSGMQIDNLDIVAASGVMVGKAGVYNTAASNLTLSNMRISHFSLAGANGLFGAGQYSGYMKIDHVELDDNGGSGGPSHNAYINASTIDPKFNVILQHSWSHDAYFGHLFKTRAQVNRIYANYFQGGMPVPPQTQAENYLLDVPNGGLLVAANNIFFKTESGPGSNAMSITFLLEGKTDHRRQGFEIRNNLFLAGALTYDGEYPLYPIAVEYPSVAPDSSRIPHRVLDNVFAGYCLQGNPIQDYRGDVDVIAVPSDITGTGSLASPVMSDDSAIAARYPHYKSNVGASSYVHHTAAAPRLTAAIGAKD
jgi:hypothetical protein